MPTSERATHRDGETRLPAAIAMLVAIALYALLPATLVVGRVVILGLEILLLGILVAANPTRMTRQNTALRAISVSLIALIGITNAYALGVLVHGLVVGETQNGKALLIAGFQVWTTNLVVFALAYWELDRGGPVTRTTAPRKAFGHADFRFSQDENDDAVSEVAAGSSVKSGWVPGFVDYLYVSCTNSTAFSPTDTMPLTPRTKLLMAAQAISSLLVSLLIVARAVGQLR